MNKEFEKFEKEMMLKEIASYKNKIANLEEELSSLYEKLGEAQDSLREFESYERLDDLEIEY